LLAGARLHVGLGHQEQQRAVLCGFRAQDPSAVCIEAGFKPTPVDRDHGRELVGFTPEQHAKFMRGDQVPRHGRGGWFIFGARK